MTLARVNERLIRQRELDRRPLPPGQRRALLALVPAIGWQPCPPAHLGGPLLKRGLIEVHTYATGLGYRLTEAGWRKVELLTGAGR